MLLTYILTSFFQSLFPKSRPIISYYVTCHVTTVTYLFIVQENKIKNNIKSRKIDKKKRKIFIFKHTIADNLSSNLSI